MAFGGSLPIRIDLDQRRRDCLNQELKGLLHDVDEMEEGGDDPDTLWRGVSNNVRVVVRGALICALLTRRSLTLERAELFVEQELLKAFRNDTELVNDAMQSEGMRDMVKEILEHLYDEYCVTVS